MRVIHLYLIGYFALVTGAGFALWQAGILSRVGGEWSVLAVLIAVGLGVLLAATSARPTVTRD